MLKKTVVKNQNNATIIIIVPSMQQGHPSLVLLAGKSQGQRSLVGCGPWGRKESDMTERLSSSSSRKEPGRLQSMGLLGLGHN